ncbi:tyrosinase [Trichoderma asperellum]
MWVSPDFGGGFVTTGPLANMTINLGPEGVPYSTEFISPHIAGHLTIGSDPGADIFASPGDPAFYVHHGTVDRKWILWQAIDPAAQKNKLGGGEYGHITWANTLASREAKLSDIIDLGCASEPIQIADIMDTLSGPFCYLYP